MKFNVEKNIEIEAPLSKVRTLIQDFKEWNSWSPWTIIEPECPIEIEGNPGEVGHSMHWEGKIIGSGKNTLSSIEGSTFNYDLEFIKPWKSKAKTSLILEDAGTKTKVTWTMKSSMPFFLFFMVKTMKNWIGMDYDRGLRMLKEIAENDKINCTTKNEGSIDYKGFSYLGIKRTVSFNEMPENMKKDFEKLERDIVTDRKKNAEKWICIYPKFDMRNMNVTYIAAVSDENLKKEDLGPDYIAGQIQDSNAIEIKHDGSYDFLGNAWSMGMMIMQSNKHKKNGFPFEQYWNNPQNVSPNELKTSVFFPIKS